MEEVNYDEWMSEVSDLEKTKKVEELFGCVCKKCGSDDVEISPYNDTGCADSGCWGEAGVIIKCRSCGNAIKIIVEDN